MPAGGMHKTPVLENEQIRLEPLEPRHATDEYVAWLNDAAVNRFLEVRFLVPQTRQTVLDYIAAFAGPEEKYGWAIVVKAAERVVGSITIPSVNRRHLTCGIGIMIGAKDSWGASIGKNAFELVIDFAFDVLGMRRITEHNIAANHASNFMLRRLGFVHEGTIRQAYRAKPGSEEFVDGFEFALLASDWRARQSQTAGAGHDGEK